MSINQTNVGYFANSGVNTNMTQKNMSFTSLKTPTNLIEGKIEIDDFMNGKMQNGITFFALGGVNQIGLNMNMYHYKGTWIIVDCGSGFTNKPGIDILVPSTEFIIKNQIEISAMFITHLHEDHIGGLMYFFRTTGSNCKVYTTKLTYHFLKIKLEKAQLENKIQVEFIEGNSELGQNINSIKVGEFLVTPIELTHSTPGMNAYLIGSKDSLINIFHTGDWKFDEKPIIGAPANEFLLKQMGNKGVNAIICDSTNVFNPHHTTYEGDLAHSLERIIKNSTGTVFVTTFGSNYGRVISIQKAAIAAGKKVLILGKSMENIIKAAQRAGIHNEIILQDDQISKDSSDAIIVSNILSPENTSEILRCINENKLLVIATGCQGEYLAAMSKIARSEMSIGTGFKVKLRPNDTVIFSSKRIPGNEYKLEELYNLLYMLGAKIVTENDHFVHSSGHCSQPEMLKMFQLLTDSKKDNFSSYIIPVHGSLINTNKSCDLVESWVKTRDLSGTKTLRIRDGSVVNINHNKSEIIDHIRTEPICVNGNQYIAMDSNLMKTREAMQNGIILISIYSYKSRIYNFKLSTPGYLDFEDSKDLIMQISNKIKNIFLRINNIRYEKSREMIQNDITHIIRNVSYEIIRSHGKMPHIEIVYINELDAINFYKNQDDETDNESTSEESRDDSTSNTITDQFGTKIIKNIPIKNLDYNQDQTSGGIIGGVMKNGYRSFNSSFTKNSFNRRGTNDKNYNNKEGSRDNRDTRESNSRDNRESNSRENRDNKSEDKENYRVSNRNYNTNYKENRDYTDNARNNGDNARNNSNRYSKNDKDNGRDNGRDARDYRENKDRNKEI